MIWESHQSTVLAILRNLEKLSDVEYHLQGIMVQNGALDGAFRALEKYEEDPQIVSAALGLLWNLSFVPDISYELGPPEEYMARILRSMRTHMALIYVQQVGLAILANTPPGLEYREAFLNQRGIQFLRDVF